MRESLIEFIRSLPLPEPALVVIIAMTPVLELRGAIPVAQAAFDMAPATAFGWSVLGNMIPVPLILWLFPTFYDWSSDHLPWLHRRLTKLAHRTESKHRGRFERLRSLALVAFVAIPLPVTGAWSGSLAAVVFGVEKRRALGLILVGVLIAGLVVTVFVETLGMAIG